MQPLTFNLEAGNQNKIVVPDYLIAPFQVGVALVSVNGAVSVSIEIAYDDPNPTQGTATPAPTFTWLPVTAFTAKAAPFALTLVDPCSAIRIVKTGAGTAVVRVIQAGK